jgi:glycosyltransferase involved in cell wall biosynthesis
MRITFIAPTVSLGGGTRVMAIYALHLMRRGHSVRVISPPAQRPALASRFKSWLKGDGWPRLQTPATSHLAGTNVVHQILDRWRPVTDNDVPNGDIIVATWWETAEWVYACSPNKGAKVYFIQHHEVFPYLAVDRSKATYRLPMHKIVVARWLREVMHTHYGDPVVDVVPNSVDRFQFFADERGKQTIPTVGFLYSTVPSKGMDLAFLALELVRSQLPDLRIICFGSEQPCTLPKGVEFFFSPPQDKIKDLYAKCDVWLTASRSEGFNLPAMEAMACRTPVVSTRTGWPEEAVKTRLNGVLVDVDDYAGLAEGLFWVLSQSDKNWRAISSNAYLTVASSSWEQSAEQFERALKHACRRSTRGEIAGRCDCISDESEVVMDNAAASTQHQDGAR